MKGLLHSKRFRTNLYRWLFMYVGVMMLLTTVITYSKYLTNFGDYHDDTRITTFRASIAYTDENGEECLTSCNTGTYRPTSKIKYYFTVDTEFEVLADLFLTIRIEDTYKDDFKIVSIRKIKEGEIETNNPETIVNDVKKSIEVSVEPNQDLHSTYEVVVQYSGTLDKDKTSTFDATGKDVIAVGYAAEQKDYRN